MVAASSREQETMRAGAVSLTWDMAHESDSASTELGTSTDAVAAWLTWPVFTVHMFTHVPRTSFHFPVYFRSHCVSRAPWRAKSKDRTKSITHSLYLVLRVTRLVAPDSRDDSAAHWHGARAPQLTEHIRTPSRFDRRERQRQLDSLCFLIHHHDCELDAKILLPHPDSIESFDLI